ncbi:hypothetical protein GCM10009785_21790 [Brooklawnia cerclae]|uniref:Uncharacterized protein n=1 Tax=Brooklawnia cerclae TaxID=349934 RepID=A0ABX0SG03_9ACTN|nr:hypothetical protein [Brooklawnia cerclae]NIH57302.1 hypothetical protein [Brooklawnia cerclae]
MTATRAPRPAILAIEPGDLWAAAAIVRVAGHSRGVGHLVRLAERLQEAGDRVWEQGGYGRVEEED